MLADAASAPLLKARLTPTSGGTRIVGDIYWAALYASDLIRAGLTPAIGLGCVIFGVSSDEWVPAVIGVPLVLSSAWLAWEWRHVDDVLSGQEQLFRQALLDAFAR